jgi:uncharacterized glyoxalase superfamily protein PhnB
MDITIENGIVRFTSSVMGEINAPLDLDNTEMIDAVWFHLAAGGNVTMVSALQCTINGQSFTNTTEAIGFINNL